MKHSKNKTEKDFSSKLPEYLFYEIFKVSLGYAPVGQVFATFAGLYS